MPSSNNMSSTTVQEIIFAHGQILDNVKIAFPILYKGKLGAVGFKIVTCEEQGATKACVVWGIWGGPTPKPFIEGGAARGVGEAYDKLLAATNALLGDLRSQGKLKEVESFEKSVPVTAGGFYDSEPNEDPQFKSENTVAPSTRLTPSARGTPGSRGTPGGDYFGRSFSDGRGLSPYSTWPYAPRSAMLGSRGSGLRAYSTPDEDR